MVAPRDAATVCLVREGAGSLEVYLMRRPASMRFAAGMHVFPGGAVEALDVAVPFVPGADLEALARRASSTAPRALLAAAVRETFEECGVLLAADDDGRATSGWPGQDGDRAALEQGRLDLAELLGLRDLALAAALLPLFGHWITPAVEGRRFDTRFFVSALPEGQLAREVGDESDGSDWWAPGRALTAYAQGRLPMLFPTAATLSWLAAYDTVAGVLAGAREAIVRPVLPAPRPDGHGWYLVDGRTGVELDPTSTAVTAAARDVPFDGPPSELRGTRP